MLLQVLEDTLLSRGRYDDSISCPIFLCFLTVYSGLLNFLSLINLKVVAIATGALDVFKAEAKKMVVQLVDMERAFVPPQHFIRLVQRR